MAESEPIRALSDAYVAVQERVCASGLSVTGLGEEVGGYLYILSTLQVVGTNAANAGMMASSAVKERLRSHVTPEELEDERVSARIATQGRLAFDAAVMTFEELRLCDLEVETE